MRIPFPHSPTVPVWLAAAALSVLLLVDVGALALTRLSAPDRTREAGHAAARAADGLPLTQRTALVAYDAARTEAADHALRISADDFRVLPDGRVHLTGTRTAPTLLLHRIPRLRDHVEVSATATVEALPYRSAAR